MGGEASGPYDRIRYVNPDDLFKYYGDTFYGKGEDFWRKTSNDLDGMLGGFTSTNKIELEYSEKFLCYLFNHLDLGKERGADIGAGIGRITENILQKYYTKVDLIEPIASFIDVAKEKLNDAERFRFIMLPAQKWIISDEYDCFWIQWVLMFLTDDDCIKLLVQCKNHLTNKGVIVVKENVSVRDLNAKRNKAAWNPEDHSLSRTYQHYLSLFKLAGLIVYREKQQPEWSIELQPLICWALRKQE